MSSEHGTPPSAAPAETATRFDRAGESAFNLALRVTGSPGAAWHATVAAFVAVAERIPADAPAGTAERDLLLMGCWHARGLLTQLAANPEYAAQLRAHDATATVAAPLQAAVVAANEALPVDQREVLALRGLSDLDHAELSALLRVAPGLLATMLAQSRLMLRDAMRGGQLATDALADPEDRHALALAALRQDGQLRGPEGRERLSAWLEADASHGALVDALEEAGLSYRAWTPAPVPAGLREAVVAAAAQAVPAPSATTATEIDSPTDTDPGPQTAAESPSIVLPAAPRGSGGAPVPSAPVDSSATVEWSTSDVAALGLEGANVGQAPVPEPAAAEGDPGSGEWDDAWDTGEPSGELLQPVDRSARAPRWQIALVAILLVAIVIALVVLLTQKDSPTSTTPTGTTTPRTTTTKKKSATKTKTTGAVPSSQLLGELRLPNATIRISRG